MKIIAVSSAALAAVVLAAVGFGITHSRAGTVLAPEPAAGQAVATFAGGCFWCMEPPFDKLDGVVSTTSGYTAGKVMSPTYESVSAGSTGHTEAVRVVYDPQKVTYQKLLDTFWVNVDPVDARGQFCDKGSQYRPGIFAHDEEQKRLATDSKAKLESSGRFKQPLAVGVEAAQPFYVAEDYHQDYYTKNPLKYKFYRYNCGRDARLQAVWGEAATQ